MSTLGTMQYKKSLSRGCYSGDGPTALFNIIRATNNIEARAKLCVYYIIRSKAFLFYFIAHSQLAK
jgi:hypothetical protein